MNSRKVLLAGAAGFIGSNFARKALEEKDWQIVVFDNFSYASNTASLMDLKDPRLTITKGDIANRQDLADALHGIDLVVNFAAESHNDNSLKNPRPFLDSNIIGTFNLLEEARARGFHYHHISTDEVFGDLELDEEKKFTEFSPVNPSSPYSATKASSDLLVRAWIRSFGVNATVSNCSNNYGPRQHVEKFIPRQITNVLSGGVIKLYGAGTNVRDWIHVDDHNDAILTIIDRGKIGETYLIGADGERSNLEIAKMINQIMGRRPEDVEFVADRQGHDVRYAIDSSKLRNELGWAPKHVSIEKGLAATIDWYSNNRDWWIGQKGITEDFYRKLEISKNG
jgi:dTDP-glucose 4,6-dehydratase